ncbi:MAG TPA: NAD(P)-dependent oxidoreductase [Bacteroidales bacterium]|nr:NAD(P)-dependent oxidoreductase [Bacteroidales bacterium]
MQTDIKSKRIGWIGLGAMGTPMAKNLIAEGMNLIVYNRTKTQEAPLKQLGAKTAESPAEVLHKSDILFIMVSDDSAVAEIFSQSNGLLNTDSSGKTIINMSTISPSTSIDLASKCNDKALRYIDAPVAGSIKQASEATLVIMAGCDESTFAEVKPLLEILGKATFRMGNTGNGNKTKLAVNLFLAYLTQGLAEASLFAEQLGIPSHDFLEVIGAGGLNSPYTNAKGNMIRKNEYPSAFALHLMAKDLRLAIENGLSTESGKVVFNTFQDAKEKYGDQDVMAIAAYLKENKSKK